MTVNLSILGGAGAQFLNDSGRPLSGGKLYSYVAGTTTPQATYTSASGLTAHTNPIVLDSAGRVATGEIWVTAGQNYKFVLKTSTEVTIATWDNMTGINGTGITSNAINVVYDPSGSGAIATTVQAKLRETVSVLDFGADNTGATDCSTEIAAAYAYATATGGELYFPAGTYLGQFTFNGEAPVRGAGQRRTVLKPSNTSSYCVRLFGSGGDANLGATLSNLSITSTAGTGTGLLCGNSAGSGFSNGLVERLEISGFADNLLLNSAIMCTFRAIWSANGTYGLRTDSENNVTTCHFDTCRFTTNDYGIKLEAGIVMKFTNCNAESNAYKNLWLYTSVTQGPTRITFDECWFEDLTALSGNRYSVHLDMQSSIAATKAMAILFNRCVITSPSGLVDVRADYAQDVVFDRCAFSVTAGFTATKFSYATGSNAVRVWLKNCGTIQLGPTSTLYASFPALTRVSGGVFGFFYEFTQVNGNRFTNYEVLPLSADATSLQVAYATTLVVDTSGGTKNINSLLGGSDGQILRIIKPDATNSISVKNNGTGTEKILTASGSDVSLTSREGITLVCSGSTWYEAQYT